MNSDKSLETFFKKLAASSITLSESEQALLQDAVSSIVDTYTEEELQEKSAEDILMSAAELCQIYLNNKEETQNA